MPAGASSKGLGLLSTASASVQTGLAQAAHAPASGTHLPKAKQPAAASHAPASLSPGLASSPSSMHTADIASLSKPDAKASEHPLQSNRQAAPAVLSQAATGTSTASLQGRDETDVVMEEAEHVRQTDSKPWTSTSLAGGLMDNMKHLQAVRLQSDSMLGWLHVF